jgi:hypothetical protein
VTTPTQVPETLIAGDTWEWARELEDYPAGVWEATWYFERLDANFAVPAVADGATHAATVAAATTAAYKVGAYRWRRVVTRIADSVRKTIEQGWLEVEVNPAAAGNVDHRSQREIELDAINAYLRDPTNLAAANYSLGNRSLSRWNRAELVVYRDKLEAEVKRERAEDKGIPRYRQRRLYTRMNYRA